MPPFEHVGHRCNLCAHVLSTPPSPSRFALGGVVAGVVLVTDAIAAMGLDPGRYHLGTMEVEITDRATIVGTETLVHPHARKGFDSACLI